MLTETKAFSGFAVDDIERARAFYGDTLGIKTSEEYGLLWLHLAGDRDTLAYPKPGHTPADYTILNFPVDDIEAAVDGPDRARRAVRVLRRDGAGRARHHARGRPVHRVVPRPRRQHPVGAAGALIATRVPDLVGRAQRLGLAAAALAATYLVVARAVVRGLAPRRHRALLAQLLDAEAGPPPGARPAARELAERWAQAVTARDWDAASDLLAEDLHVDSPVRHFHGRSAYLRGARSVAGAYAYRRVHVDEVVGEAAAPHVAWVRFTQTARPRRGRALEATWWECWTLDAAHDRVLEIDLAGVTRLVAVSCAVACRWTP